MDSKLLTDWMEQEAKSAQVKAEAFAPKEKPAHYNNDYYQGYYNGYLTALFNLKVFRARQDNP